MTLVGKILVIVIMFFSIVFLGVSTVVFTTAVDWKKAHTKQTDAIKVLQTKNGDLTGQLEVAKKDLDKAKSDHTTALAAADKRIAGLDDDIKRNQAEITDARTRLETAVQASTTALAEAKQRFDETSLLRDQKSAVEKQANEYKVKQTELLETIRTLQRQLETIDANNKDLRDRVARFSTLLRRAGLSDDIKNVKGTETPPNVEGEIKRVHTGGKKVEITIGSDDGLVPGHELYVYRTQPRAEYIGKIRIQSTDPDVSVGIVIGNTLQGKRIQEGDHVSSTIRPRS
jgi:predicted  nucleic acid-binding Zn-ribbon protein